MNIVPITQAELNEFFKENHDLAELGFSDYSLKLLKETGEAYFDTFLLGLEKNGELIGVWSFHHLTQTVLITHGYIKISLHNTGLSYELCDSICEYIKKHAPIIKVLLMTIPDACPHIIRAAKSNKFKEIGIIEKGVLWRDKIINLHLYSKEVM